MFNPDFGHCETVVIWLLSLEPRWFLQSYWSVSFAEWLRSHPYRSIVGHCLSGNRPLIRKQIDLAVPQIRHRRASIWLADEAIRNNDTDTAVELLADQQLSSSLSNRLTGWAALSQGNLDAALQVWMASGDYRSPVDVAAALEEQGDLDGAYDALRAAQAVLPERGTQPLVDFLLRHDGTDEAIRVLAQAIEAASSDQVRITWLRKQGQLLRKQQAWPQAQAVYRQLATLDAADAYVQLAALALDRGDGVEAALEQIELAIAADPARGATYYEKARLLAGDKRYADADLWYREAIARDPGNKGWQVAYANNARNAADYPAAIYRYQQMIERFPDDAGAYYELAWALNLAGESEAAKAAIAAAIQLVDKPNAAYHLRAATIDEQAGDIDGAMAQLNEVLALDANNATAKQVLARLTGKP